LEFSGPYPSKWNNYYDAVANRAIIEWSADCNNDGIVDYGQILDGTFADVNADGVPDACQAPCLPADLNNDGLVDGADLGVLLSNWGPTDGEAPRPDINGNGIVDGADLGVLLANWGPCGGAPAWATVVQWQPDPAVVTDDQLRSAIAATGLPWRVRDTSTQIEMLLVPPGTFQMGCIMGSSEFPGCYGNDLPVHQVALSSAFYLGRYEVTQLQWVTRMGSNPSSSYNPTYPVGNVSWNTVQGYLSATGFRLPTEAEWEYACRAGTRTPFHSGPGFQSGTTNDYLVTQIAWWDQNTSSPRPVGGKAANALGFHDMLGNMWEWVNDWYDGFTVDTQTNPMGPTIGDRRVIRGRSWNDDGQDIVGPRSSDRGSVAPDLSYITVGFRVARTP
jgi:formylglycine-generating enzyme required for sulfatase activity